MGTSAAEAIDGNRDAAPAAMRNLTLRIGFVLLSGEAEAEASHQKLTLGRCLKILKRHLTLIIKVDNLLRRTHRACACRRRDHAEFQYFAARLPRRKCRLYFFRFAPWRFFS